MIIEWMGQSSFKIKSENKVIYIDPYAGDFENAEKADLILITHHHHDHFSKEKINLIRVDDTKIVSTPTVISEIDGIALKNGEETEVDGIKIKAVPAYNETRPEHDAGEGNGYLIEIEGKVLYHAGDTDLIPEINLIHPDLAMLPVGGTYTMDAEEAVAAALILQPKVAIPMHWGMEVGHEDDAIAFKEGVEQDSEIEVKVLQPGDKFEF